MAELPDLGEHCSLKICNKLDFTPFKCAKCSSFYCMDHRFNHGCARSSTASADLISGGRLEGSSELAKQFLCSFNQCFAKEYVRMDCSQCNKNYCLKHRLCEEHDCESLKLLKAEMPISEPSSTKQQTILTFNKVLKDPVHRARADKVTIMKLKMKNTLKIPTQEQWFLCVNLEEGPDDRFPIMISKSWSIGKVVDTIRKQLNLQDTKERWNLMKMPRTESDTVLPFSDNVAKHLSDMSEVVIVCTKSD